MAITCPKLPALLPDGLPPPGSVQWCEWIDSTIAFMSDLGVQIAKWLNDNLDYWKWYNALNDYRNGLINAQNAPSVDTWIRVLGWILDIFKEVGKGLDVAKQLLSCLWELRKLVLPNAQPEAYLGTVLIRDILLSIRNLKLGSQSYLGFTVDAFFNMPALDRVLDYLLGYLLPIEIPTVEEATAAWSHGYIDEAARDCVWKSWGHNPKGYKPYVLASTRKMDAFQSIEWVRRNGNDPVLLKSALLATGFIDDTQRTGVIQLYDRLQSEGQALQWDRTQLYNEDFVRKYGLDAGFSEDYWPRVGDDLVAQGITQDIAKRNYLDHWARLGEGTLREMVYRLRPDNPNVPHSVTEDDYKALLKAQGFSPWALDRLTQLLHRPLSIGEAQNLWYRGLLDPASLQQAYYTAGYSEIPTNVLLQRETILRNQWRAREYGGWTPQRAGRAYAIGLLSSQQLVDIVTPLGADANAIANLQAAATTDFQYRIRNRAISRLLTLTVTQVRQSISVGIMDVPQATAALTAVGWPTQQAQGIAQIESATARIALVKQTVNKLRTALLAGEITVAFAEQSLHSLGIVPGAASQYIAIWNLQNTPGRKRRTAGQIVNDLAEGTLSIPDGTARLTALGYSPADIQLFLADAERKTVNLPATAAEPPARMPIAQRARDRSTGVFLPGISKRVIAELVKQETPAQLKAYLKDGAISEQYLRSRLQLYGYTPDAVNNFVNDALGKGSDTSGNPSITVTPATPSTNGTGTTP